MKTRKLLLTLLLFTFIPFVQGHIGGDEIILNHFENCVNMSVLITGNQIIDNGEYVLQNCTEINKNQWFCECDNSYDLTMKTKSNTINDYTIAINYTISSINVQNIDTTNIFIVNKDIIMYGMTYDNNKLLFTLSSNGTKIVNISIGALGCPYRLYVDNINTAFSCDKKNIIFTTHFSEKEILLDYNFPSTSNSKRSSDRHLSYFNETINETIVEHVKIINDTIEDNSLDDLALNYNLTENEKASILNDEIEVVEGNETEFQDIIQEEDSQLKKIFVAFMIIVLIGVIFLVVFKIKNWYNKI